MKSLIVTLALLLGFGIAQNTQLESTNKRIKAGLVQVVLQDQDAGNITVSYQSPMPDSSYLKIASPAFVSNFNPDNGLQIATNCSATDSQTQLSCSVLANTTSANNIIYMTYLVSDQQDFLVGAFSRNFFVNGTTLITTIEEQVALGQESLIATAKGEIGLVPFISGVETIDEDFELQLGLTQSFNTLTSTLLLEVKISEFHTKNISVVFSFILFLPQVYIFSSYPDYTFEPQNDAINKQVIFYIRQINNRTASLPTAQPTHRLQTINIPKTPARTTLTTADTPEQTPFTQADFQRLVQSGNFSLRNMRVHTVSRFPSGNNSNRDSAASAASAPSIIGPTTASAAAGIAMREPIAAAAASMIVQPTAEQRKQELVEANQFTDIFSSNGMTIILNSSVADPIIYLQLNPYVDIQTLTPRAAAAIAMIKPIVVQIVIRKTLPVKIDCPRGFLILQLKKVDTIQYAYEYECVMCQWGEYFDWVLLKCVAFPSISDYLNIIELA